MTASVPTGDKIARKRPWSVPAVAVLFLVLGTFDLWKGANPLFAPQPHLAPDDLEVLIIGVAALVGGVWLLKRRNWARWLLVAWMTLHTGLSATHPYELLGHVLIFGVVMGGLFHPAASAWFHRQRKRPTVRTT